MRLRDILEKPCIIPALRATSKQDVIQELAQTITKSHASLQTEDLVAVLIERENLGSTGIGNGVAIPHAKMKGVSRIIAAFGKSDQGVEFGSQDDQPAFLFFVLVAPENAAGQHLKALAKLSRILKNPEFRSRLIKSGTQDEIFNLIMTEDEKS